MYKFYPSRRYHASLPPVLVMNEEEDKALGKDWADTPAAFGQIESPDPDAPKKSEPEQKIVLEESPVKHKRIKKNGDKE